MLDKLYKEYLIWLKEKYDITPESKYMGVNELNELKALRDEFIGLSGDTELVKIMKEDGVFEKTKLFWEKNYSILTFDEYINVKKNKK